MSARSFHLGDLLSVSDGHLIREMDGVYDVIGFLTGEAMTTVGLVATAELAEKVLLSQLPFLREIKFPAGVHGDDAIAQWLSVQVAKYGEHHSIVPIAEMPPSRVDA